MSATPVPPVSVADLDRLVARDHHDPHAILGAHAALDGVTIRALHPAAESVVVQPQGVALERIHPGGLFEGELRGATLPVSYELELRYPDGGTFVTHDPYRFAPTMSDLDEHLFREGRHEQLWSKLGAPRARARRRAGDVVRRLGAGRAFGLRRRRLQLLGRPPAHDARARGLGHLGAVRARRRRRRALQVRDPRAVRRAARQGRPVRVRDRAAAADGVDRARARRTSGTTPSTSRRAPATRRTAARCPSTRSTSARGG